MNPPLYNGRLQARRESCKEEMRDYVRQMGSLKWRGSGTYQSSWDMTGRSNPTSGRSGMGRGRVVGGMQDG